MLCEKCKKQKAEEILLTTMCQMCGEIFICNRTPVPILCPECSKKEGICQVCKESMWEQMSFDDLKRGG